MENVGRGMVEQYLGWMDSGQIVSLDGQVNYSEGLVGVDIPALLVAGRVDHIVPVWTVQEAYDRLGSEDKTLVILGVGWGERHDYGHGDLLVGDWVEEEVFPRIPDWMELRLGRQPEPVPGAESAPSSPSEPGAAAPGIEDWGEEPGEAPDGLD